MEEKVAKPVFSETPVLSNSEPINIPVEINSEDNDPKIATPEADPQTLIPQGPYWADPLFYEVANYLGVNRDDYENTKNHLSTIVEYLILKDGNNDPGQILSSLRKMENSMTPPQPGEKRYKNVYRYVRLLQQEESLKKARQAFEKEKGWQSW